MEEHWKDWYIEKWEESYRVLYNPPEDPGREVVEESDTNENVFINENDVLSYEISRAEVIGAIARARKGKASGCDELPVEVLCNERCIDFMVVLFNACFKHGIFPTFWKQGIINPIPKSKMGDLRDPMEYRCITIACSSYKLFCNVINSRLTTWCETNNIINDEQNGFRKK